jgi:hypothetical protein
MTHGRKTSRDDLLWCPYCDYDSIYLKGSELSKRLARLDIEEHIGRQHPGKPVYARTTSKRYER